MAREQAVEAYESNLEHLRAECGRAELLLRRHVEDCWSDGVDREQGMGGYFVSDEEVARLLDPETERSSGSATRSPELDRLTDHVRRKERKSAAEGVDLRLVRVADEFGLTPLERDAFLLALLPDLDRKYEKIFGYLRDDITRVRPTEELLRRVLAAGTTDPLSLTGLFAPRGTLRRELLVRLEGGSTRPGREARIPSAVVSYLLEGDDATGELETEGTFVRPTTDLDDVAGIGTHRSQLRSISNQLAGTNKPPRSPDRFEFVACTGPDVRRACLAIEAVAGRVDVPLYRIDADELLDEPVETKVGALARDARLRGAPLHLYGVSALEAQERDEQAEVEHETRVDRQVPSFEDVVSELAEIPCHVFVSGDVLMSATQQSILDRHRLTRIPFERPGYEQRRAIWKDIGGVPDSIDLETLAGLFRLTRGEIEDAVATAATIAEGAPSRADFEQACRMHSESALDRCAQRLEPAYDWNDIVLPPDTLAHLQEVAAGIRHRGTVYEQWGFEEKFSLGNGINLLFTGPPGTGKTMAAEVIAADVGLSLYKLDLSSILSKYIGETEKNLGRVFDQAEHSNAILFFDEADALFGERTDIGDSRDRYANVEVDYLLQRMEDHDGCVIMATNLQDNIDDAFKRRINATVDFPMPDETARREIWKGIFPADTPVAELDYEYLATFELAGGSIKNVALTASLMGADTGTVTMDHLVRALRREFQKIGKLHDFETFGEYRTAFE